MIPNISSFESENICASFERNLKLNYKPLFNNKFTYFAQFRYFFIAILYI